MEALLQNINSFDELKEFVLGVLVEKENLKEENRFLRQKLGALVKLVFGNRKTESIDAAQMELLLAGLLQEAPMPVATSSESAPISRKKSSHPGRNKIPANLPVEEVVLEPEEVKNNPAGWEKIGEERTPELDFIPGKFINRIFIRPKYAKNDKVVIAPLPNRLIEKGLPGTGLLTQVILSKYEDHLPLYRQEKLYEERYGVHLSRQTMSDWVEQVGRMLSLVYRKMEESLVGGNYLQADETPVRYLDRDVPGKSCTGYLWVYGRPKDDVIFKWKTNRSREGPEEFLKNFEGKLQCDGYGAYQAVAKTKPSITLAGCWAHARRYFHEAAEEDRRAAWFVKQIQLLYQVEKDLREKQASATLREVSRSAQSRMVVERIGKAINLWRNRISGRSRLGTALTYAQNQWKTLVVYLNDGNLEIDNNLIENAIRPTAIGKKNFLFVGHPNAGDKSAIIYSLLASCRRHGVNPADYLEDVLKKLPNATTSDLENLTPKGWAKNNAR